MPGAVDTTAEEKRRALDRVLASQSFARSEQLRQLLKYLGEAELSPEPRAVSEYDIAIEVLGRPKDFDSAGDATVRNRIFSLRKRLQEYYAREEPGAPLRIELPRGEHRLQFVPARAAPEAAASKVARPRRKVIAVAALAGAAVLALAAALLWPRPDGRVPDAIREAWGPLLDRNSAPLVCIATPAVLIVRQFDSDVRGPAAMKAPPELDAWFQTHGPAPRHGNLYLNPTRNAPLWGDAMVANTVDRVFQSAGIAAQTLPERVIGLAGLKGRNVILAGAPEYSRAVSYYLRDTPFSIHWDETRNAAVVIDRHAAGAAYVREPILDGQTTTDYGLITAIEEEQGRKVVVFSGITSGGAYAAAEFFSSAVHMSRLLARFGGRSPRAYQVLIRSDADAVMSLNYRYETHRVIAR